MTDKTVNFALYATPEVLATDQLATYANGNSFTINVTSKAKFTSGAVSAWLVANNGRT